MSHVDSPQWRATARTASLSSPASASGVRAPRSAAARMPGPEPGRDVGGVGTGGDRGEAVLGGEARRRCPAACSCRSSSGAGRCRGTPRPPARPLVPDGAPRPARRRTRRRHLDLGGRHRRRDRGQPRRPRRPVPGRRRPAPRWSPLRRRRRPESGRSRPARPPDGRRRARLALQARSVGPWLNRTRPPSSTWVSPGWTCSGPPAPATPRWCSAPARRRRRWSARSRALHEAHPDRAVLATRLSSGGAGGVPGELPGARLDEVGRLAVLGTPGPARGRVAVVGRRYRRPARGARVRGDRRGVRRRSRTWYSTWAWPGCTGCWPSGTASTRRTRWSPWPAWRPRCRRYWPGWSGYR